MQLKQAQKTADNEKVQKIQQHEKTQQQWSEKYNVVLKENDNVKRRLDLQQVEIIKLKDRLRDFKFQNTIANETSTSSTSSSSVNSNQFGTKRFSKPVAINKKSASIISVNCNKPTSQLCKFLFNAYSSN